MTSLLRIEDLTVEVQVGATWRPIIKNINLELQRGTVIGLVGESGAGKSTMGLATLGYLKDGCRVREGRVCFNGESLFELPTTKLQSLRGVRIAYVAQSAAASFNPSMRLMQQVVESAVSRGEQSPEVAQARARDLFRALQLPQPDTFGARYPHQVSGGQLQRAMTAMALMCNPELVVFDEPTTALDVLTQVEVLISIRKAIKEYGVSALYITHDLAIVSQIANRVAVLRDGVIVEQGTTGDVISQPQHPYTKSLWAVQNVPFKTKGADGDLLKAENLTVSYGSLRAVDDASLRIGRGETVALVGASGSGKTTLARAVAGLVAADSGGLIFCGSTIGPLRTRSKDILRRIQIIYQSADTSLNPTQSVGAIIGRPLTFYHGLRGTERRRRVKELMSLVDLDFAYTDRGPRQLSGGERQRVAIARALAAEPDLIVCDEVTSSLDKIVQAEILNMLMQLQDRLRISYLFITHDIEVVSAVANRVAVMDRGKIVEQGLKDKILQQPGEQYTKLLLSALPEKSTGWLDRFESARNSTAPIEYLSNNSPMD